MRLGTGDVYKVLLAQPVVLLIVPAKVTFVITSEAEQSDVGAQYVPHSPTEPNDTFTGVEVVDNELAVHVTTQRYHVVAVTTGEAVADVDPPIGEKVPATPLTSGADSHW